MRPGREVGATVLLAALVAACAQEAGEDLAGEGGAQRQEYVDAIVALEDENDDDLTPDQRRCVAESFVDGYGADEIAAAGVTPDDIARDDVDSPDDLGLDFSDEQAAAFYQRLTGCMDIRTLLIESIAGDGGAQLPGLVECLDENLTDDLIERIVIIGYTQGEDGLDATPGLDAELEEALTPCLAPGP
ncbi:MAG TPA: hypothetical protein VFZ79_12760 [Acidimicrobiales bacterium]